MLFITAYDLNETVICGVYYTYLCCDFIISIVNYSTNVKITLAVLQVKINMKIVHLGNFILNFTVRRYNPVFKRSNPFLRTARTAKKNEYFVGRHKGKFACTL